MASPTSWEFYKEVETKTLWVNICTQNLEGVAISINKWWKTRYPAYKIRIVSKKEFELFFLYALGQAPIFKNILAGAFSCSG